MSDPITLILWCADTSRLVSMMASHLLHEGLLAVNQGRIDDQVPVMIGVANQRRWPIFAPEVTARRFLRSRSPRPLTAQRHDFLLTFTSGKAVDSQGAPVQAREAPVIEAHALATALSTVAPSACSSDAILELFNSVGQTATITSRQRMTSQIEVDLYVVADQCQRLVAALAR